MTRKRSAVRKPRVKSLYKWHRRVGVSAAIFLIWIVISGWLLNHSESLGLAQGQVRSQALASWYGLATPMPTQAFTVANHWLAAAGSQLVSQLVLDGKLVPLEFSTPLGLVQYQQMLGVANSQELLLLDSESGQMIDRLSASTVPLTRITRLGLGCEGMVVADDSQAFVSQDGVQWSPCEQPIIWSQSESISPAQSQAVQELLVPAISIEKILVDLHTGRFFGRYGPYLIDLVGLCLLLLALSGLFLYWRLGSKR